MKKTRRCRLVAELSTRHLPATGDASLTVDVEREDVAVVRAGTSPATERSCRANSSDTVHHLSVPEPKTSTSPRHSERPGNPGRELAAGQPPDDVSPNCRRRSETTSYRREITVSVRMAVIVVVFGGMWTDRWNVDRFLRRLRRAQLVFRLLHPASVGRLPLLARLRKLKRQPHPLHHLQRRFPSSLQEHSQRVSLSC